MPFFQPIVSARQKAVVGVEALARAFWDGQPLDGYPLFDIAERSGLRRPLEQVCRANAIREFAALADRGPELALFLNLDIRSGQPAGLLAGDLLREVLDAGLQPANVAVEILENEFKDAEPLAELAAGIRDRGFLIVLDDVGVGHSNLDRISSIRPHVLKVDRGLIQDIHVDYHKRGTLKGLIDLARKIGALVVVEGVESEEQAIVSLELGADLLQGYFLGRPLEHRSMSAELMQATFTRIEHLAHTFRDHMVGKINDRRLLHRRFNVVVNQILCDLASVEAGEFDRVLLSTIERYPDVECAYVLDHHGIQVTDTVCNPQIERREHGALFRPAPRGSDHSLKEYYYILLDVELHKFTTDPYVSTATGNVSQTISTYFRDARDNRIYVLCVDVHAG